MKILFINLPYYGHVMPTIGLVQDLIKRDCEVTYLLPYDFEATIAESGATFYGYQNHKKLSEQIKNAYSTAESIIETFDFVIYEQFFFLGKHLAEKYNKPVVRIFTAPVTNKLLMNEFITAKLQEQPEMQVKNTTDITVEYKSFKITIPANVDVRTLENVLKVALQADV